MPIIRTFEAFRGEKKERGKFSSWKNILQQTHQNLSGERGLL